MIWSTISGESSEELDRGPLAPRPAGAPSGPGTFRLRLLVAAALLGVLLLAGLGVVAWWVSFTRSPAYSIEQLSTAMRHRDWDGFQKYVDVEAIAAGAFGALESEPAAQDSAETSVADTEYVQMMGHGLADTVNEGIKYAFDKGPSSATLAGSVFSTAITARDVKSVAYTGGEAAVVVEIPLAEGGSTDVKLRMKRVGDHWRVVAVENAAELVGGGKR
jgi:hypothetical protein